MEGAQTPKPINFLERIHKEGIRYLLIGRRAVIAYGGPVQTMDYDIYIDGEQSNMERLLSVAESFDLNPSIAPEELPNHFKFRLENSFVVDVFRAKSMTNDEGTTLTFDKLYKRKKILEGPGDFQVNVPNLDDLIELKKIGREEKDQVDIEYLKRLREKRN